MYQFIVSLRGGCVGIKRKDILFFKVCVPKVGIAGNNGIKDGSGIGLPEDLQGRFAVYGRIAHGEEEPSKLDIRVEILSDFFDGFADLDNRIKLKVPG